MVKVKGLQTAVGEYGTLRKGKVVEVRASLAKTLQKEGIAEIVSEDDGLEPSQEIRGGVRIIDTTGEVTNTDDLEVLKKAQVITPAAELFETSKATPAEESKAEPSETSKAEPEEEKKVEPKETGKKKA